MPRNLTALIKAASLY